MCDNVQPRNAYNKNYFYDHKNKMPNMTHICFYCNIIDHAPKTYNIKKIDVPSGKYVWIEKGNNPIGPKHCWIPRNSYFVSFCICTCKS